MALWGVAKVVGRSVKGRQLDWEMVQFAEAVAAEASSRLDEMSSQSISNVAWALGSLELGKQRKGPARDFLLTMAASCGPKLQNFHPQAIANMSWAISRVSAASKVLGSFASFVIQQATSQQRSGEFTWQDLASLASAMSNFKLVENHEVREFVQHLVLSASMRVEVIGTQSLLNLALAASKVSVDNDALQWFCNVLESAVGPRPLNDIDRRQLAKVQAACRGRYQR